MLSRAIISAALLLITVPLSDAVHASTCDATHRDCTHDRDCDQDPGCSEWQCFPGILPHPGSCAGPPPPPPPAPPTHCAGFCKSDADCRSHGPGCGAWQCSSLLAKCYGPAGASESSMEATASLGGTGGIQKWAFVTTDGVVASSPVLNKASSVVFVGSMDSHLYAINASTGLQKWNFTAGDAVQSSPALSKDEKTVFVGSWDWKLYAIDASTGSQKWAFTTDGDVASSPAVSEDGSTVFVGSYGNDPVRRRALRSGARHPGVDEASGYFGSVFAIDAHDGSQKWKFVTGDRVYSSPALSKDGSLVFVGSWDKKLYAIDTSTGLQKWAFTAGDIVRSSPVVSDDGRTVYVGSNDGNLHALDASTGSQQWAFAMDGAVGSRPALSKDGTIFVGSEVYQAGKLYAIDAGTGSEKWNFTTGGEVSSSPALSEDGSTVFVGSEDGKLYAINASTGSQKWAFTCPDFQPPPDNNNAVDSSPAVSKDGTMVYVGSDDGKLYAVHTGLDDLPPCVGRDLAACSFANPSMWCCNLEARHCTCAEFGTTQQIRKLCDSQPNRGVKCAECGDAPQCH